MTPRAAIFDLDGTLVDNMRFHAQAWVQMSRELGVERDEAFFATETAGRMNREILALLLDRGIEPEELERLAERKETLYRELYRPHVAPVAGLPELLRRLAQAGTRRAIATLSPPLNRAMVLGALGLDGLFDCVVGAERVARGKPAPDAFLQAAAALGMPPEQCVAFEDAVNGVQSARAAGMEVAGICTATRPEKLREAGARWILEDYASLPSDLERRLL